jgi:hypothetical protein
LEREDSKGRKKIKKGQNYFDVKSAMAQIGSFFKSSSVKALDTNAVNKSKPTKKNI